MMPWKADYKNEIIFVASFVSLNYNLDISLLKYKFDSSEYGV
jgi:hypothetical protein